MVDTAALKAANEARWSKATATRDFSAIAKRLIGAKPRYKVVEARTGVPWYVIAVIHMRESSQNWMRSLAQGDPWDRPSTHVPKGRGPFASWEDAAVDALVDCAPFLAKKKDWSLGATLVNLELYNGAGYASRGVPSPYVWAGTDQYRAGKYVADGVYDPNHVDLQPGCAGMLLAMKALDSSISFSAPAAPKTAPKIPPKVAKGAATGTVVAGTVAAGVQQGWGATGWAIAAGVAVAALVAFLILRKK